MIGHNWKITHNSSGASIMVYHGEKWRLYETGFKDRVAAHNRLMSLVVPGVTNGIHFEEMEG